MQLRYSVALPVFLTALFLAAPQSKADILVGQCVEFAPCWIGGGPTAWSDTLSLADLTSLGLGSTQDFWAAQTAETVMLIGVTTVTFDTSGAPVTETLPELTGGAHSDPCNYCEVDLIGTFLIPLDATDATISGFFGNSVYPYPSGGANLLVGNTVPTFSATPEPSSVVLLGSLLAAVTALSRRKKLITPRL